jgi:hypothetical protein
MISKYNDDKNVLERRYKCKISESEKHYSYYEPDYRTYISGDLSHYVQKKERLFEISITQEGLSRLEYDLSDVDRHRLEATEYYAAMQHEKIKRREEEEKRARNPAAAKAYEKYLLLLNMTSDTNGKP